MKYCKKHDQEYMDFLRRCPICAGEEMGAAVPPPKKMPAMPDEREDTGE